jgi:hypothetical protein
MARSRLVFLPIAFCLAAGLATWAINRPPKPDQAAATVPETSPPQKPTPPAEPEIHLPAGVQINFVDVTKEAGVRFQHFDGRTDMQYIMDQTGSGLGWLDYDGDGLMDLFIVQGYSVLPPFPSPAPTCKLYKNLGHGRFRDVTDETGIGHVGFGQGVAIGDIDNDGFPDVFITCFGKPNVLYHNVSDGKGGRKFVNITVPAGLGTHADWQTRSNYSTSAAFLDYNNDGHLDLFVCSYVKIDLANYPDCRDRTGKRDACPPNAFDGTRCVLYRNNGNLTFTDVSQEAGIDQPNAKALGVLALDLDDDGLIDIFVANDTVPNFLFRNLGNGKFQAVGPASGCAVNLAGRPQAYMGVDADDLHGEGRPDIYATAFARETDSIFRNLGHGQFLDVTRGSGIGPPTWHPLGFGVCFLDVDRDGSLDIAVVNGHVSRNVDEDGDPNNTFRQKALLFLNDGKGHFQDISRLAGKYFQEAHVGRGLAACDYDNDGHMDLAISNSGEPAVLLHNESTTPHHWIRLTLQGTKSNRDAVGAKVTVWAGGRSLVRHRKGGGSYCSAGDPRLLIGLGTPGVVDRAEIRWPSGATQRFEGLSADHAYRLIEGDSKARPE